MFEKIRNFLNRKNRSSSEENLTTVSFTLYTDERIRELLETNEGCREIIRCADPNMRVAGASEPSDNRLCPVVLNAIETLASRNNLCPDEIFPLYVAGIRDVRFGDAERQAFGRALTKWTEEGRLNSEQIKEVEAALVESIIASRFDGDLAAELTFFLPKIPSSMKTQLLFRALEEEVLEYGCRRIPIGFYTKMLMSNLLKIFDDNGLDTARLRKCSKLIDKS
jgi:hypothetical protein